MFGFSASKLLVLSFTFTVSMIVAASAHADGFPKRGTDYSPPVWEQAVSDGAKDVGAGYASIFRKDRCATLRNNNRLRQAEGCAFVDGRGLQHFGAVQPASTESTYRRDMCALLKTNNRLWRENGCRFPM